MIAEEEELAKTATMCARTMPKEWEDFLVALAKVAGYRLNKLVNCPVTELQAEQGRARAWVDLVKDLRQAPSVVDKLERRT